jgi:hypothetical protein
VRSGPAVLALAIVLFGCGIGPGRPSPVPPPTLPEALDHLASVEAAVNSGDLSHLCETFGSGTCSMELRDTDAAAVPRTDPAVIGTGIVPPESYADGTWSDGGRILRLCGRDGLNNPYYSEVLVFKEGGRMISIGSIYWIGTRIATDRVTDASPASPPPCPT